MPGSPRLLCVRSRLIVGHRRRRGVAASRSDAAATLVKGRGNEAGLGVKRLSR